MTESALPQIITPDQRLRIFISSTLGELAEERKIVKRAIEDLKLYPVMFEQGARPHPPRELYRAYLQQSQIYIGIFWESYGWVAPNMDISGIEDEYNLSVGKPRLIYIKESNSRQPELEQLLQKIRDDDTVSYKSFSSEEQLSELVKNDVMVMLTERFGLDIMPPQSFEVPEQPPSYLKSVVEDLTQQGVINRKKLEKELLEIIKDKKQIAIYGNPGTGKTFILGKIGENINAIYISLRNKTSQQVFSHLASHLMIRRNQYPANLPSEDIAKIALQEQLANSNAVIFVDDADQNTTVTQAILGLDFFGCKLVFATRIIQDDIFQGIERFQIPPFERDETEQYLRHHGTELPPGEFQNLLTASQGNPLYLYYFTNYQLSPLPKGLNEFHKALWSRLTIQQKELLSFISLAIAPLATPDLHELLNADEKLSASMMETKDILDTAAPLINQVNRSYQFFHPLFEEFVRATVDEAGLHNHYHKKLGEYAAQKEWMVSAAYHFLKAEDPRIKDFLLDGSTGAFLRGDWWLAETLLQKQIEFAIQDNDKRTEAKARHLLAENYIESGLYPQAKKQINLAIKLYEDLGENELKEGAEIEAATLLIEEGQIEETIKILTQALKKHPQDNNELSERKEIFLQINLSFAYLRRSLYKEGAAAAKRALELSTKLNDERATYYSLLNLAGCTGKLGNHEQQMEYANQLIEVADRKRLPRLKAAGLNLLAGAYRYLKNPVAAQKVLEECIAICQNLGSTDLELMNIGNLGNAFRDQDLYDKAEASYMEVLNKSRAHNLPKHEGYALEHLARLNFEKGLHKEAIEFGEAALKIHEKFGEQMRLADTKYFLARSFVTFEENQKEAAEYYEASGKHYKKASMLDDAAYSFNKAAKIWNSLNQLDAAAQCVYDGVEAAYSGNLPYRLDSLLKEVKLDEQQNKLGEIYIQAIRLYSQQPEVSFTSFIYDFVSYCKKLDSSSKLENFKLGLNILVDAIKNNSSANLLNALAVGIEQASSEILPLKDLNMLIEHIVQEVDHLHYRHEQDDEKMWTIGLNLENPIIIQIFCLGENSILLRIASALSIIFLANKQRIEAVINEYGGNKEEGFTLHLEMNKTFMENLSVKYQEDRTDSLTPASILVSGIPFNQPQSPSGIVLDDTYEMISDWSINPDNKAFVWILLNTFGLLIAHCTHQKYDEIDSLAKKSRELCEHVLL
jgi:tetratricopeptide (TPR) repeat protein